MNITELILAVIIYTKNYMKNEYNFNKLYSVQWSRWGIMIVRVWILK